MALSELGLLMQALSFRMLQGAAGDGRNLYPDHWLSSTEPPLILPRSPAA